MDGRSKRTAPPREGQTNKAFSGALGLGSTQERTDMCRFFFKCNHWRKNFTFHKSLWNEMSVKQILILCCILSPVQRSCSEKTKPNQWSWYTWSDVVIMGEHAGRCTVPVMIIALPTNCPSHGRSLRSHTVTPVYPGWTTSFQAFFLTSREI